MQELKCGVVTAIRSTDAHSALPESFDPSLRFCLSGSSGGNCVGPIRRTRPREGSRDGLLIHHRVRRAGAGRPVLRRPPGLARAASDGRHADTRGIARGRFFAGDSPFEQSNTRVFFRPQGGAWQSFFGTSAASRNVFTAGSPSFFSDSPLPMGHLICRRR